MHHFNVLKAAMPNANTSGQGLGGNCYSVQGASPLDEPNGYLNKSNRLVYGKRPARVSLQGSSSDQRIVDMSVCSV